ncbi:MAG: Ig-like domain-containing protein [Candidatus Symbiothrix sp.]|nr:Ig-like domain-containing protein [Candidatus Symbiothrix sp.]
MKQRTKRTWVACLAALWLVLPAVLQAQVHIGGTESAVKGALLDLTIPEGSNLGLLPLNVSIEDINEIPDAFTNKASITAGDLQGLIVYNTNGDLAEGTGLYVWDGAQWNKVGAAVPATGVSVSPTTLKFTSKTTSTLTATVEPPTAVQTVTWDSNNTAVAMVSDSGVVTAVANGTATITVTTASGKTATCAVAVSIPGTSNECIGDNCYATYCYGGNIGCWMVQNSKEGTAGKTSDNNIYYYYKDRVTACVSPWSLPSVDQWNALMTYLSGSGTAIEKAMWFGADALLGYYDDFAGVKNKGKYGEWWTSSYPSMKDVIVQSSGFLGIYDDNSPPLSISIRCIRQ